MKRVYRFIRMTCLIGAILFTGCTAEQWQGTIAATALVGIAVLAVGQPQPPTTTCRTISNGYVTQTTCTTY